jgi:hypothetical protein
MSWSEIERLAFWSIILMRLQRRAKSWLYLPQKMQGKMEKIFSVDRMEDDYIKVYGTIIGK